MDAFDVAIIGAGPAGASTALSLTSVGLSVVLLDSSNLTGFRPGEVLCPGISSVLIHLGVWERFLEERPVPAHGIWSSWDEPRLVATDHIFNPYGAGWLVDRARFDRMLITACEQRGARAEFSCGRIDVRRDGRNWQLTAPSGARGLSIRSHFVVDATGRSSTVARSLGIRRPSRDRLVALIGVLCGPIPSSSLEDVLLVESAKDGWWYRSVLPSGEVVAAYFTDSDLVQRADNQSLVDWWRGKLRCSEFIEYMTREQKLHAFHARSASTGALECSAGPGWIAVGDASHSIDPLSGTGIASAMQSALLACRAVRDALDGTSESLEAYSSRCMRQFEYSLEAGLPYYGRMLKRWPDSSFWGRRLVHSAPADRN